MKLPTLSQKILALFVCVLGATLTVTAFQNCAPQVNFSDVVTEASIIQNMKPTLAVNQTQCIFCHAAFSGNIIIGVRHDYAKNSVPVVFHGDGGEAGEYIYGNWSDYKAKGFVATAAIKGTVFMPHAPLSASSTKAAEDLRRDGQSSMASLMGKATDATLGFAPFQNNTESLDTLGRYFNFALNTRTPAYKEFLKPSNADKTLTTYSDVQIRELDSIAIRAPTQAEIRSLMQGAVGIKYVKESGASGDLSNFGNKGSYYGNEPGQIMDCDGDIFVDGVVFLKDLKLRSNNGCRIYATGSVYVEAPVAETENRPAITYIGNKSNLQISSSRMIGLGLGQCDNQPDVNHPSKELGSFGRRMGAGESDYKTDYLKIKDAAGNQVNWDAGNCGGGARRSAQFDRILLNAQQVHSRYTGHFNGVIVADFVLWSLGRFVYSYDKIFEIVPILPKLAPSQYLSLVSCAPEKQQALGNLTECVK